MFTETRKSNFSLFFSELACSGGAAAISKTAVAPLERIKVLLQAQRAMIIPQGHKYRGFIDALTRIPREQGVLAFWRGNGANIYRIIPTIMIRFTSYDAFKRMAMSSGEYGYTGSERFFLRSNAAFLSGLITLTVTYPFEMAKTRLSLDFSRAGAPRTYTGVMDCLRKTKRGENLRAIYKGYFFSIGINLPYSMITLATYDLLKDMAILKKSNQVGTSNQLSEVLRYIGLGTLAGLSAQLITYPLDTVRKTMQINGALGQERIFKSTLHCFKEIFKTEGIQGFYRGMVPNFFKFLPAAAIQFTAYDLLKQNVVEAGLI